MNDNIINLSNHTKPRSRSIVFKGDEKRAISDLANVTVYAFGTNQPPGAFTRGTMSSISIDQKHLNACGWSVVAVVNASCSDTDLIQHLRNLVDSLEESLQQPDGAA